MATLTVSREDEKRVKELGFFRNKGTDNFSGRVITVNGKLTADRHIAIGEAAKRFGNGNVIYTTRLTVEVQGIPYEKIDGFRAFIEEAGMTTGGTGARVRPVVSCKGTTCRYGRIDTFALSEKIHRAFYEGYYQVRLPHKFKIAVGGCPNNCVKPGLNDVGIVGRRVSSRDTNAAADGTTGYKVYIGGRWGKDISHGKLLDKIFTSQEEVLKTVEKAILFYKEHGKDKERFAQTIDRIGFDKVEAEILSDDILTRKQEILGAE